MLKIGRSVTSVHLRIVAFCCLNSGRELCLVNIAGFYLCLHQKTENSVLFLAKDPQNPHFRLVNNGLRPISDVPCVCVDANSLYAKKPA